MEIKELQSLLVETLVMDAIEGLEFVLCNEDEPEYLTVADHFEPEYNNILAMERLVLKVLKAIPLRDCDMQADTTFTKVRNVISVLYSTLKTQDGKIIARDCKNAIGKLKNLIQPKV